MTPQQREVLRRFIYFSLTIFDKTEKFFFLLLIGSYVFANQQSDLSLLLRKLQKAEDLSIKTKQESAGYVITFTREDLDRMHIKSIKEILERIPFLRYNEDAEGLTDLLYIPFQPSQEQQIKIYLDDKETSDTLFGNSLQVFSEMDLSFIDHIEIYLGAVTFALGTEPSLVIIKLYTKKPSRENASILDIYGGSHGQKDVTFLSAKEMETYNYLLYANYRLLKRKKYFYNGTLLKKDKEFSTFYGQVIKNKYRAEFFASNISLIPFTADALSLQPQKANVDVQILYGGIRYDNNGWNSYLYTTYVDVDSFANSNKLLGIFPTKKFPYFLPFKSKFIKAKVNAFDAKIAKSFLLTSQWDMLLGIKGRYKRFIFKENRYDNIDKSHMSFNKETQISSYIESKYLLNKKNIAFISFINNKYFCNGGIDDYSTNMLRLGYIYNTYDFMVKFFVIDGDFKPSTMELLETSSSISSLHSQHYKVYALELQKKVQNSNLSLLFTKVKAKDIILRDLESLRLYNKNEKITFDNLDIRYQYYFNSFDKIELEAFVVRPQIMSDKMSKLYGAHTVVYKKFENLDFYNALVYRKWTDSIKPGIDVSFTINYHYNDKLTLYCKGINIFGTAIKSNYYGYDVINSKILHFNNISVIDRTFLVGLEYQF